MDKYSTTINEHTISIIASNMIEAEYIFTFILGADFTGFYKVSPATKKEREKVEPFIHFLEMAELLSYEELLIQLAIEKNQCNAYLLWEHIRRLVSLEIINKTDPENKKELGNSLFSHDVFLEIADKQSIISRQLYSNLSMKKLIQKQIKENNIFKQYCILEIIRKKILDSMEHFHSEDLLNRDHEDIYGMILLKCFSAEEFVYWPE